jgi:hypothetical protein
LLYVPLEIIMSKYYGESERLLGNVFSHANDLPDGAIVFLDEVCITSCFGFYFLFLFCILTITAMLNLSHLFVK